jgi:hypothetical protein
MWANPAGNWEPPPEAEGVAGRGEARRDVPLQDPAGLAGARRGARRAALGLHESTGLAQTLGRPHTTGL